MFATGMLTLSNRGDGAMKNIIDFVKTTLIGGLLVILPLVLIAILIKHGAAIIHPLLLPVLSRLPSDIPFPRIVALMIESLVVILVCFAVGLGFSTRLGRRITNVVESRVFSKFPGYVLLRSLTRGVLGQEESIHFKVALSEMEGGLVPSFIIEEHADGRYTVFVPAAPTLTSGAIYIFPREIVHIVDMPFSQAAACITRLGLGSEKLLQGMQKS
jgi:uncharacterized membrane protein